MSERTSARGDAAKSVGGLLSGLSAGRMSEGSTVAAKTARAELARRWADVSTAKRQAPIGNILQQTIQARANIMSRRAQMNISMQLPRDKEAPKETILFPQPPGLVRAAPLGGTLAGPLVGGLAGPPAGPRIGPFGGTLHSQLAITGPTGLSPPSSAYAAAGPTSAAIAAMTNGVASPAAASAQPQQIGKRANRLSHMTNFELERLFALTASPSIAAAMRCGGLVAKHAVARLREAMVSQRHNRSESYLRTWDTDTDRSGVTTVPDSADRGERARGERGRSPDRAGREAREAQAAETKAADEERCERALAAIPEELLTISSASEGDPCAICQDTMLAGEGIRRMPCGHVFHAECIGRWMRVKLTCPLDALPIDEGINALSIAAADAAVQVGVPEPASAPPPPLAMAPPLPAEPEPAPPAALAEVAPSGPTDSARSTGGGAARADGAQPPIGLQELQVAAEGAGVSVVQLTDALARRREEGPMLVS